MLKNLFNRMTPPVSAARTVAYQKGDVDSIVRTIEQYAVDQGWQHQSTRMQFNVKTGEVSGKTVWYFTGLRTHRSKILIDIINESNTVAISVSASPGLAKSHVGLFGDPHFYDRLVEGIFNYLDLLYK